MSMSMDVKAMTAPVTKALTGLSWPATKQQVIEHVSQNFPDHNGGPDKNQVIRKLENKLTDRQSYDNAAEVMKSLR